MKFRLLLISIIFSASCAGAQESGKPSSVTINLSPTQAVQLLIASNRLEDARRMLQQLLAAKPDDSETLFLMATVEAAEKNYDTAISLYRRILVHEPGAERV